MMLSLLIVILVDADKEQQADIQRMAAKLADLIDCSCINIIKFHSIPESISASDLKGQLPIAMYACAQG